MLALRKTTSNSQIMFAAIPLIFSLQQFTEGLVWLSLTNPAFSAWTASSIRAFLFFAQVLWPLWAPLAVLTLEKDVSRKKILRGLVATGLVVSLYLAYHLVMAPVHAQITSHHIRYDQDFPLARLWFSGLFYFLPTVVPTLISSIKNMWIMGLSAMLSYILTQLYYPEYLTSVWCFFAAIISIEILLILPSPRHYRPRESALRPSL